MGSAVSVVPDVLSQEDVKRLAGDKYRDNVFLQIANEDLTITRRQFEHCAELADRNLLRYVVVGAGSGLDGRRVPKQSPHEMQEQVALFREQGNLLEAAVTAQRLFMAFPASQRCLDWMRALHAYGASPGRLVNLSEGYCSIYPDNEELHEFLVNARKKVAHPFEEVEDHLYMLTEEERQRVDHAVDALNLGGGGGGGGGIEVCGCCLLACFSSLVDSISHSVTQSLSHSVTASS